MYREYSLKSVAAPEHAKYWQQMVSTALFPFDTSFKEPDRFNGVLRRWDLGQTSLVYMRSSAVRYERRPHHIASDDGDAVLVSFPSQSDVGFTQDGVDLKCGKNQFFLEKGHEPSAFVQPDANAVWVLKLPVAAIKRHIRSIEPYHSVVFDADAGAGGLLFDMLRLIPRRHADTTAATAEGFGETLIELLVLALEQDDRALTSRRTSVQRGHLGRIEKYIRRNLGNPALSPDMVAGACGISVRYLHALFHGSGISIVQWIRELRLDACHSQLRDADRRMSVAEIAHRWGFNDPAQLSRHFKARFGRTPREMRSALVT